MDDFFHQFYLLEEGDYDYMNYQQHLVFSTPVEIEDDLIMYLYDTLRWVPNDNNNLNKPPEVSFYGLDLEGRTIIGKRGARMFRDILLSWANLFSLGPDSLTLTGRFELSYGKDNIQTGNYQKVHLMRDETVNLLRILADWAARVVDENVVILHLGL